MKLCHPLYEAFVALQPFLFRVQGYRYIIKALIPYHVRLVWELIVSNVAWSWEWIHCRQRCVDQTCSRESFVCGCRRGESCARKVHHWLLCYVETPSICPQVPNIIHFCFIEKALHFVALFILIISEPKFVFPFVEIISKSSILLNNLINFDKLLSIFLASNQQIGIFFPQIF